MTRLGRYLGAALLITLLAPWAPVQGQGNCLNQNLYPGAAITPNSLGAVTEIAPNSYEEEYSHITGILAGAEYEFTLSSGGYITVRSGTFDGPVLGQGSGNITVTTTGTDDLFPHWNTNEACGTAGLAFVTTVQLLLNCTPPTVEVSYTEDCDLGAYYINLNIISTGDEATVDIIVDQGGSISVTEDVGVGPFEIGPIFPGEDPSVTVAHAIDPLCNLPLGVLAPFSSCPINVTCGTIALDQQYCYGNNEDVNWLYQASTTGTMRLSFISGGIQGAFGDSLYIYDGMDATAPLLFQHLAGVTTNLAGLSVDGVSGHLFMRLRTNATTSCVDGSFNITQWNWQVGCGNCQMPAGTAALVTDCPSETFMINVDITSLGDAPMASINYSVNGGNVQQLGNLGLGQASVGPFPIGDVVSVILQNGNNAFCEVALGSFEDPGDCANIITCGSPAEQLTYCYVANDARDWLYTASGAGTLRLKFLRGTIESAVYDRIYIFDGADNTAPILWSNDDLYPPVGGVSTGFPQLGTGNLGPVGSAILSTEPNFFSVEVFATGSDLYMEMSSDGSIQCNGSTNYDSWLWEVVCLDCTIPQATFSVVDDCLNNQFSIPVIVTSTGNGAIVNIVYTINGGEPQTVVDQGVGTAELGPFSVGDVVNVTVEHESNELCNIAFGNITDSGECPTIIECGVVGIEETYCYVANDARDWRYQAGGAGTMRLRFLRGTIESAAFDRIYIFDGADNTAPILWSNDDLYPPVGGVSTGFPQLGTGNLGPTGSAVISVATTFFGVEIFATGTDLYMEMSSDGSVQCNNSTTYDSWLWEVVCLDCTIPQATYAIVDDCANDQFSIPITVTSTGDGAVVNIVYIVNGGDPQTVINVGVGSAALGPFSIDDTVNVVVEHESNFLCNVSFGNLTDTGLCPDLVECGTELTDMLCYGNNVDRRYYYQGTGTFPIAIFFDAGAVPAGDLIRVYDGADINAPVLYNGNNGGNIAGIFALSTNPEHRLTLRITSNATNNCATSVTPVPVAWRVGCLDCNPAVATFSIVQDCENFQYFVDVTITDLGSDLEPGITTNAAQDTLYVTATGTYQIGPFVSGTALQVTIVNDANSLCNVRSSTIVNPLCPAPVECPGDAVMETYCYIANDAQAWAYELQGTTGTLRLTFDRGTIESAAWDRIYIFDGADNTAPILWSNDDFYPPVGGVATGFPQLGTGNLGPTGSAVLSAVATFFTVDVAATGQNLYMEMSSDGSAQCATSTNYDPWDWQVYCINCTTPAASFNIVEDCLHRQYTAEVIVTDAGGDAGLAITNTLSGESIADAGVGVHVFGPYAMDSLSHFQVTNQDYVQCRSSSDTLTYLVNDCISVSCGSDNYNYCYENNEDRWYTYQSAQNVPMSIGFLQGQMLSGDRIILYNGRDASAAVLYQGNNGGNLTGFALNSANVNNMITLRIQSNATGSCDDGQALSELRWAVQCGAVGMNEVDANGFAVYPNPTKDLLQIELGSQVTGAVRLRVLDMSGRVVIEQPLVMNGGTRNMVDMGGLQSGQYLVQLTTEKWVRTERVQLAR